MIDESSMKPTSPRILTINGGSSSIKFALFGAGDPPQRLLEGAIERIGQPEATLRVKDLNRADNFSRLVTAPDHTAAVGALMDWIVERSGQEALTGIGPPCTTRCPIPVNASCPESGIAWCTVARPI